MADAITSTAAVLSYQWKRMFNGDLNLSNSFAAVLASSASGDPSFTISTTGSMSGLIKRAAGSAKYALGTGKVTQTTSGTMYFITTPTFTFTATSGNLANTAGDAPKYCFICPEPSGDLKPPIIAFQLSSVSIVATQITVQMPTAGWFEISRNVAGIA